MERSGALRTRAGIGHRHSRTTGQRRTQPDQEGSAADRVYAGQGPIWLGGGQGFEPRKASADGFTGG